LIRVHADLPDGGKLDEEFGGTTVTVGRGLEADLVLRDVRASKEHARVQVQGGRLVLTDLDSSNGTAVNDRPVTEPVPLAPSDEVRIGRTRIFFELIADLAPDDEIEADEPVEDVVFDVIDPGTTMDLAPDAPPPDLVDQPLTLSLGPAIDTKAPPTAHPKGPIPPSEMETRSLGPQTLILHGPRETETVDLGPPGAESGFELPPAVQAVMGSLIARFRRIFQAGAVSAGYVDARSGLPVAPFVTDPGESATPCLPRAELVKKASAAHQSLIAEVTAQSGSRQRIVCIPLIDGDPVAFLYAAVTGSEQDDLTETLAGATAELEPYAAVLGAVRDLAGGPAAAAPSSPDLAAVAGRIRWYVGESKRSLFMMDSGIKQNNLAHVRAGHDNMRRLIRYFEALATSLAFVAEDTVGEAAPFDLRQVARVTVDAVTGTAAEHFITVACRVAPEPLHVRVDRDLLESALCGLLSFGIMRAREGDEIDLEALTPDGGETAWVAVRLPAHAAADREALRADSAFLALQRIADHWNGAIECAPDSNRYLIRVSFPCESE
jgi:pSer/pThr/pTyr-binding forkhead associated (FHA) protein